MDSSFVNIRFFVFLGAGESLLFFLISARQKVVFQSSEIPLVHSSSYVGS